MKKVIAIVTIAALALMGIVGVSGCVSERSVKTAVSAALKDAYALGGSTAVSNRIERLVIDGKLTREQADNLHIFAQGVYERIIEDLDAAPTVPCENSCEDDAYCGECAACRETE